MICRRGGIDKQDIGAIRIMDTTTEFEISERVAESFAVKIRRPDKEDNIRIEALAAAPQEQAAPEQQSHPPRRKREDRHGPHHEKSRDERKPKQHGKPHAETGRDLTRTRLKKKKRHGDKPAYVATRSLPRARETCFRKEGQEELSRLSLIGSDCIRTGLRSFVLTRFLD